MREGVQGSGLDQDDGLDTQSDNYVLGGRSQVTAGSRSLKASFVPGSSAYSAELGRRGGGGAAERGEEHDARDDAGTLEHIVGQLDILTHSVPLG